MVCCAFNKLKTTPIANNMAKRGGGSYALILRDFYAIWALIVWHAFGGIFFLQIGGGGGGQSCDRFKICLESAKR